MLSATSQRPFHRLAYSAKSNCDGGRKGTVDEVLAKLYERCLGQEQEYDLAGAGLVRTMPAVKEFLKGRFVIYMPG